MLIGFQVENFRSFKERQTLSMVVGRYPEHRDTHTIDTRVEGLDRLLRSVVVYGPNAAGKTNLLRAVEFMKSFVVRSAAAGGTPYAYSPFKLARSTIGKPAVFEMAFIQGGIRYEYGFSLGPTHVEYERLVEYPSSGLKVRGRTLFDRVRNSEGAAKDYRWRFNPTFKGPKTVWAEATRPDALFLSTAVQLNSVQLRPIYEWFQKRLIVIVGEIELNQTLTLKMLDEPEGKQLLLPFLRQADLGIADLEVTKEPLPKDSAVMMKGERLVQPGNAGVPASLITVRLAHDAEGEEAPVHFPLEEESSGTFLLFKMAGAWLNVLRNGEVLLIDEIDRNMHPSLLRFLIGMFHSNKINGRNAQLICNTHNTTLLHQDLFRRDQVWFVDKAKGGASRLYPLSDFRPRNDEVLEDWYMRGRYGAQPMLPGLLED